MRQTILFISSFIAVTNTVLSQTSAEKYFQLNSISFVAEHCSKTIEKKKEVKKCYWDSATVRIKNKTFIESRSWSDDRDNAIVTSGDLLQIDFDKSKVTTTTDNGPDALPVVSYLLKLEGKNDTWPFIRTNKYLKPKTDFALYLPFATLEDALDAEKYLKSLVGIN
ncbi:MAG: hypothetical protein E6H07_07875 [Bacteroidetes bacterium]|nr:MAG: hypothetical protein E6H07_07875 [Bacteroidota bacterium]